MIKASVPNQRMTGVKRNPECVTAGFTLSFMSGIICHIFGVDTEMNWTVCRRHWTQRRRRPGRNCSAGKTTWKRSVWWWWRRWEDCLKKVSLVVVVVVALSSLARIWGKGLTIHSLLALGFFSFFFLKLRSTHATNSTFFRPGSVHGGSASWNGCG